MANRFTNPYPHWENSSSQLYAGGKLYFYLTGTSTATPTYSDATLSTENANPVVLSSAGSLPDDVFLDPAVTYKVVLTDANDVTIWTADPVVDPAANVSASFQVYNGNPNGNVAGIAGTVGGSGASAIFDTLNSALWVCTTTGTTSSAVWTQIGALLSGAVRMTGIITPTSLAADANNYEPPSLATSSIIRQNASGDVKITGLAGGASGRLMILQNISSYSITLMEDSSSSTAANRFYLGGDLTLDPNNSAYLWYDASSSRWRLVGAQAAPTWVEPGGRLTISSGEPVLTSDVTAQTTVYYTPYKHNMARLWNGTNWYTVQFSELSQTLADATKSPLAAATGSVYDLFLWNDAGTIRCTRGPAWDTTTSRGTGAGTTQLQRIDGVWTNQRNITNGPLSNRGVYVGSIATNATGANGEMAVMIYPNAAAGGSNNRIDVWNYYNRVPISVTCRDSTDAWTYDTATWRAANNNNANRITAVFGINDSSVHAIYSAMAANTSAGEIYHAAVGVDSTTAFSGVPGGSGPNSSTATNAIGQYMGMTGIGLHYFQALEKGAGGGTTSWKGDAGTATSFQMALMAHFQY